MGMPGAGKDTLLEKLQELARKSGRKDFLYSGFEPYSSLKVRRELSPILDEKHRQEWYESYCAAVGSDMALELDGIKDGLIFLNRSFLDNYIFCEAELLGGRLENILYLDTLFRHAGSQDITFFLMVPPETSFQRKPREKPGLYMNKRFLRILYSQYLRYISLLTEEDGGNNIIVMDTSGSIEGSFEMFLELIEKVSGKQFN